MTTAMVRDDVCLSGFFRIIASESRMMRATGHTALDQISTRPIETFGTWTPQQRPLHLDHAMFCLEFVSRCCFVSTFETRSLEVLFPRYSAGVCNPTNHKCNHPFCGKYISDEAGPVLAARVWALRTNPLAHSCASCACIVLVRYRLQAQDPQEDACTLRRSWH